jgi:hypothetical protein
LGLFDPILVEIVVETDDKVVADTVGRCPQVTAGSHHTFQHLFFLCVNRLKTLNFLAFGYRDRRCTFQQLPCLISINLLFARINNFSCFNFDVLKKLLSIFAGGSPLAQIGPINLHGVLLFQVIGGWITEKS